MTELTTRPCPPCGGDPPPQTVPWVTTRTCPRGIAVIVCGVTVAHLGGGEAAVLGRELEIRARLEDPFYWQQAGAGVAA